ncbi:MAG TPA: hypothetical protein VIV61_18785 [Candidatus Ozemobacteraceae bacterium]
MSKLKPPQSPPDDVYTRLNAFRPVCERPGAKKHPCPDCFSCQFCSDARCTICLAGKTGRCCRANAPTPSKPEDNKT